MPRTFHTHPAFSVGDLPSHLMVIDVETQLEAQSHDIEVNGGTHPYLSTTVTKGNNLRFSIFHMQQKPSQRDLLLKERICSFRSKFFALRVEPQSEGAKKSGKVVSAESLLTYLKMAGNP